MTRISRNQKASNLFQRLFFLSALLFLVLQIGCTCSRKKIDNSYAIALKSNIAGLDPAFSNDIYSYEVIAQIYEGLIGYHYFDRPLQLVPKLAEALPTVSEDGLTHTFKIKKGVYFHDDPCFKNGQGRELRAQDFIYSFKRVLDPKTLSDGVWIFDGKVKGAREWRLKVAENQAAFETPIEGFRAPDDHTLIIETLQPYHQLHHVLTQSYAVVVPQEAVEHYGPEFINYAVGTGPYRFVSWVRNSKIELMRNPKWRKETYPIESVSKDSSTGDDENQEALLPFIDKLTFFEMAEAQPRWLQFLKGQLDEVEVITDGFDSAVDPSGQLKPNLKDRKIKLHSVPALDTAYLAFNFKDPLLGQNKHLRRAISLAYNADEFIDKFLNGAMGRPAESVIPPGVDGYRETYKGPFIGFDLEQAKMHLIQAGFEGGTSLPTLELLTVADTASRQMAEHFQQNMAQIGINVRIKLVSWPQFQQAQKQGRAQIWQKSWIADYPDAENFLQLFYGPNQSPGPNETNFKNKDYDRLFEQAARLPAGEERARLYSRMQEILSEELPWVPLAHRTTFFLYHPWVKNYNRDRSVPDYPKYLRIDLDQKKRK